MMRGYASVEVFSAQERALYDRAESLVARAPLKIDGEYVRCHELARAVGKILGLEHQDGRFGFVEHTWLWTAPFDSAIFPWVVPHVLDVYVPGSIPQVQLVHVDAGGLPPRYYLSNVFDVVVRADVVSTLVQIFEGGRKCELCGTTIPDDACIAACGKCIAERQS